MGEIDCNFSRHRPETQIGLRQFARGKDILGYDTAGGVCFA